MPETNPIQYTSTDFDSALADINSAPELADKPSWWKRIWAGVLDVASMMINAQANQSYLRTAFTRPAVVDLCSLIDYQLSPQTTSSGDVIFNLNATTMTWPQTIDKADLVSISKGGLRFEARASKTLTVQETETATHSSAIWTVARVYSTGEKVRLTTTGTLPTPLAIDTDYYVIKVSDTQIKLATSITNAFAGTYVNSTGGSGTHTVKLYSFKQTLYQQTLKTSYVIGTSDGSTQWQSFDLADKGIIQDTLTVTINSLAWTRVDTFIYSTATDRVFRLYYRNDGSAYILFSNGTLGLIPPNYPIYVQYATGGGSTSNISNVNLVTLYAGASALITETTNYISLTGGGDAESIINAKIVAPQLVKAKNTFITVEDGVALALGYGGVTLCSINRNVYGVLSCQVVIVPTGGGTSSSGFKTSLQNYLIDRTLLSSVNVVVQDASYVTTNCTMQVKIKSGFLFSDVQPYCVIALKLLFSCINKEILDDYIINGIVSATAKINTTYSTSFGSADYDQLDKILNNIDENYIGKDFNESDVLSVIAGFVNGVEYCTVSVPTFPVTTTDVQITDYGTMTVTEIV